MLKCPELKEKIIPKLAILLLISIIIASSHILAGGEEPASYNSKTYKSLAQRKIVGRYITSIVNDDLSLTLYRNETTRRIITKFYTSLSGSDYITELILKYADMYEVSPSLAFAVCNTESGFKIHAENINQDQSVDRGLFQLNSKSFPYLNEDDFFSAETNVLFGLRYLKSCLKRGQNEIVALSIYNAGEHRVTTDGAPLITLNYISRVLEYRDTVELKLKALVKDMLSS